MSASYKIALAIAAALVLVVVAYFATQGGPAKPGSGEDVAAAQGKHITPTKQAAPQAKKPAAASTTGSASAPSAGQQATPAPSNAQQAQTTADRAPDPDNKADSTGANSQLMESVRAQYRRNTGQDLSSASTGAAPTGRATDDTAAPGAAPPDATGASAPPSDATDTTLARIAGAPTYAASFSDASPAADMPEDTTSNSQTPLGSTPASASASGTTGSAGGTGTSAPDAPADASAPSGTRPVAPSTATQQASPTASAAGTAPATPKTYTVEAGDSMTRIAENLYGSDRYWQAIAQANPRVDPDKLQIGQVLRLPAEDELDEDELDNIDAPTNTVIHIVKPTENLSKIADRYYEDAGKWRYIYNANRDRIGPNPNKLKVGMKLAIPPALPE